MGTMMDFPTSRTIEAKGDETRAILAALKDEEVVPSWHATPAEGNPARDIIGRFYVRYALGAGLVIVIVMACLLAIA